MKLYIDYKYLRAEEFAKKSEAQIFSEDTHWDEGAAVLFRDFREPLDMAMYQPWCDSPTQQQAANITDVIFKTAGKTLFSGHNLMRDGFSTLFAYKKLDLMPSRTVYVTGWGPMTQFMILLFFERGYRHFKIIQTHDAEAAASSIEKLNQFFFGAEFTTMDLPEMVLLKPEGGALICAHPCGEASDEVKQALSYFNFLNSQAVIVDLYSASNQWLSQEAKATDLPYVTEGDLHQISEWLFLKSYRDYKAPLSEYIK